MNAPDSDRQPLPWICLSTGIFDSAKIKIIEAMPEGDALLNCWLRLLCMAGRCNTDGFIVIAPGVPMNPETLAMLWGKTPQIARRALDTFQHLDMIEAVEGRALRITGWHKHQHVEALARARERRRLRDARYRDRQRKQLPPASGEDGPPTTASLCASDPWAGCVPELVEKLRPAFDALAATGKLPALCGEHLARLDREYPRAKLAENFAEIAEEVRGVVGPVCDTLKWLRKAISGLEHRHTHKPAAPKVDQVPAGCM